MGNRAVITTKEDFENDGIGIYVHWNGSPEYIMGFLDYCKKHNYRSPKEDHAYGFAMLTNVITNFFGDGLSCGIDKISKLDCDNGDNGTYLIDGWNIEERIYGKPLYETQAFDEDYINEFVKLIDESQPECMRV